MVFPIQLSAARINKLFTNDMAVEKHLQNK